MKNIVISILALLASGSLGAEALAQMPDTTGLYGERRDTLQATVFSAAQSGTYLPRTKEIRTEVISTAGLHKMACCSLAESFENSASVTVGYSDAVTGARQIRLLGLSGVYTQMLDENRPTMRGISAPFGLSYVPGQWLESIQIAKGLSSVVNGVESMTGQINVEHRKPTDEIPLFANASAMSDGKLDLNLASSLQMGERWSTVLLAHISGNRPMHDMNGDGFYDGPGTMQFNFANRWLYFAPGGLQLRLGVRALQDSREGGQTESAGSWRTGIGNRIVNGYLKLGVPLNDDNSSNIAAVADLTWQQADDRFGPRCYSATQRSGFFNLLYLNELNESHKFTLGAGAMLDGLSESEPPPLPGGEQEGVRTADFADLGLFGEYTLHIGEEFSSILALRGDWYGEEGFRFSPRLTLKYSPAPQLIFRANAGRGLRRAMPLSDNIGVFSTSKTLAGDYLSHPLEDVWTAGANATWYLPFGSNSYLSLDYFRSEFSRQLIVDYELAENVISFYTLDGGKRSYTDSWQLDFNTEPLRGLTLTATFRYTDSRVELRGRGLVERPLVSRYKGVLNLQYATALRKWIFDFTASVNGPSRAYAFMGFPDDRTPAYPLFYAQITRRMKGCDIYFGGENLTNYRQKKVIFGTESADGLVDPYADGFDASAVWGPITGIKLYAGVRVTLWKKS